MNKLHENPILKDEIYEIPLEFNPLESPNPILVPTKKEYHAQCEQPKAKFDLAPRTMINFRGKVQVISPILNLPVTITNSNPSLSTFTHNIEMVITEATEGSVSIGFRLADPIIVLGGTQHNLAGEFGSGILPTLTGLNLPYLEEETKLQQILHHKVPTYVQDSLNEGYSTFVKAAENQEESPFQRGSSFGARDEIDNIQIAECVHVYTSLKRKYNDIDECRPAKMRMLQATLPADQIPSPANQLPLQFRAQQAKNHDKFVVLARTL